MNVTINIACDRCGQEHTTRITTDNPHRVLLRHTADALNTDGWARVTAEHTAPIWDTTGTNPELVCPDCLTLYEKAQLRAALGEPLSPTN
jgi:hypothetical protein